MVPGLQCTSPSYEEPRPPRRGSHRPAGTVPRPSQALNQDAEVSSPQISRQQSLLTTRHGCHDCELQHRHYDSTGHVDEESSAQPRVRSSMRPRGLDSEASSRLQKSDPASYGVSCNAMTRTPAAATTRRAPPTQSPALSRELVAAKVRSSVELIRQINGGSESFCVEQSILESFARAAPQSASCQSVQKRCMFPDCTKISVSRGFCRGHGGGRRCHVPGCTKSAQSRSNFCWAHGGGQRCDVDECMRSRKSKRFCVAHLYLENESCDLDKAAATSTSAASHRPDRHNSALRATERLKSYAARTPLPPRALPSLGQALSLAYRSPPNLPVRNIYRKMCL